MGTEFQVILAGKDRDFLSAVANEALDEVDRLEARLSHYLPDSEICDLNRRGACEPVRMEPSLYELLRHAAALSAATDKAFDCTAGPLVKCWGFFRGRGRMPEAEAVREAAERTGSHRLRFDDAAGTIEFEIPGMEVHLGAIGKGYAIDRIVEILRGLGVEAALVHGGGSSIYALGAPPGEDAWLVGLSDPGNPEARLGVIRLRDRALSTSGNYEQFFEYEGRRYSHIIDPRTGWPARGTRSASVLAGSATDTDALSTAAFVLGAAEASWLCERFPGIGIALIPDPGVGLGAEAPGSVILHGDVDLTLGDGPTDEMGEQGDL